MEGSAGGAEEEEEEARVHLLVHNIKPPFLEHSAGAASLSLSQQAPMVRTVRDPTSDMAQLATRGSAALRRSRETRDRAKVMSRQRFWELGGSRMGDALGVAAPTDAATAEADADAAKVEGLLAADKEAAAARESTATERPAPTRQDQREETRRARGGAVRASAGAGPGGEAEEDGEEYHR